ncbi:surface protease GP63 [Trypanosoma grayi]|uniref:surface protease GP63 n=1 Tax=Trypanosoma grayi TaxID=71804 RepID=UPI0004F470D7|nr:surface protease GP63 [Trypanosoma grayi]KEG12488.1 surface protease GP63 [Trypanosoma grayi]
MNRWSSGDAWRLAAGVLLVFVAVTHASVDVSTGLVRRHICKHQQVAIPYSQLPTVNVSYRKALPRSITTAALASGRRNIRFHAHFLLDGSCKEVGQEVPNYEGTNVACTSKDIVTPRKLKVLNFIMDSAFGFLQQAILVDPVDHLEVNAGACSNLVSPAMTIENKDYAVLITANPGRSQGDVIAWARWCAKDSFTGRPVVGHVNFVPSVVGDYYTDLDIHVAMHEITHALGFTDIAANAKPHALPNNTIMPGSMKVFRPELEKTVTIITTPKVVEVARRHFGCPTLDGVEVEDNGGGGTAGSHWKKRILFEEVLVGMITTAKLFYSSFTLAYLEDLGYYSINYTVAEDDFRWGRNRKCRFLYNKCNDQDESVDEFCFSESGLFGSACTHDRLGLGACDVVVHDQELPSNYQYFTDKRRGGSSDLMDYCPAIMGFTDINCVTERIPVGSNIFGSEAGEYSRCFDSNMIAAAFPIINTGGRCFPMACTEAGQMLLRIQGQTVPCPEDGSEGEADTSRLIGVHGKIKCPVATLLCHNDSALNPTYLSPGAILATASTSPLVLQSPIEFAPQYAATCEERVMCADNLTWVFPGCRIMAKRIVDCFGTDCETAMRKWLDRNNLTEQCKDRRKVAELCLDGWIGAHGICSVASTAAAVKPLISIIVTFAALIFVFIF